MSGIGAEADSAASAARDIDPVLFLIGRSQRRHAGADDGTAVDRPHDWSSLQ
jgi:hypothetical protein